LCLAGGVFQNSVINGQVLASGLFQSVHVPSVPGDQGGALGAALLACARAGHAPRSPSVRTAFLGPEFGEDELLAALQARAGTLAWERPIDLVRATSDSLGAGHIVAWFQGRMEYGPRALGHRSLLAAAAPRTLRERLNRCVKHREEFRPFAAAVPEERAADFFELAAPSPYMQFVVRVKPQHTVALAAVEHHGTTRVQTVARESDPLLHSLLLERERQGAAPVVLNTSFNGADEPIVCTPAEALRSYLAMEIDDLVMGPFLVRKREQRA
jgi:carbamoyltransferase